MKVIFYNYYSKLERLPYEREVVLGYRGNVV